MTVPFFPFKAFSDNNLPEMVSGNSKFGAIVPSGKRLEEVSAIIVKSTKLIDS